MCSVTSHGSAYGRFGHAIERRNVWAAEMAMREMGDVTLADALDYVELLAESRLDRFERAAVRWHGRLAVEAGIMTLRESQLILAALADLPSGDAKTKAMLRDLLRRVKPGPLRPMR